MPSAQATNRRARRIRLAVTGLLLLALPAAAEPADEQVITLPPDARQSAHETPARTLEEIVVTAQKIPQSVLEAPVSVSVVESAQLKDRGIFGLEGLEDLMPNVELDTDPQRPTIGIRGFGTDAFNIGLEPSVGIIVDEIPLGRTFLLPHGLFDMDRIEVLRGPQGTLFGRNTIAGVLIFATRAPTGTPGGHLQISGGERGERRIEAALEPRLDGPLQARAAVVGWRFPGEVDNGFLERRELELAQDAARLRVHWDAGKGIALRFSGQVLDSDFSYTPWQLYDLDPDALDYARSKDPEAEDDPFDAHTGFDLPGHVLLQTHLAHAIADIELPGGQTLTAIAGSAGLGIDLLIDFDISAADLSRLHAGGTFDQQTLELRLSGGREIFDRSIDYVAGLFAYRSTFDADIDVSTGDDIVEFLQTPAGMETLGAPQGLPLPVPAAAPPGGVQDDGIDHAFVQDALALAAFGQATWSLTQRLSLITGLRLGRETKDAVLSIATRPQPAQASLTATVLGAENFTRALARRERELSPRLGLQWHFGERMSAYASWSRGFKSGGFNGQSFADQREGDALRGEVQLAFEPERGDNYELGVRARLAGGAMRLGATVYRTDVSDKQVSSFNGVGFDVSNAAAARLQGVETELSWLTPWEWLSIQGSLAIASARYVHYPRAPAAAESDDGSGVQDLSGRTLPKAPEMTAAFNPVISLPLNRRQDLGLQWGLSISHRGDQYLAVDLDSHSFQPAHTLLGSFVRIGPGHGRWSVTLRGSNLGNVRALSLVSDHNLFADSYFSAQIPLRSVSASVLLHW